MDLRGGWIPKSWMRMDYYELEPLKELEALLVSAMSILAGKMYYFFINIAPGLFFRF